MKVLVLNCGSSSIKYKLYDDDQQLAEGLLEWREGHLRLTRRGIILSNQVFIRFV